MTADPSIFDPHFTVDAGRCIHCGACAADCVAEIIAMRDGLPFIAPEQRGDCIGCQHCLAVCPAAAVSVIGKNPTDSPAVDPQAFAPDALAALVRARRSVRQFKDEPVPPALLKKLLDLMAYAPTGVNSCRRRVTVIDDRQALAAFRDESARLLVAAGQAGKLPGEVSWLADMANGWIRDRKDGMFRNAPHLMVVTVPQDAPCPDPDALIALSYFDLLAQAHGVGTVWAGLVHWLLTALPELRTRLGIPADHAPGYAMLFGLPAVHYPRAVQRAPENVARISRWP